jgi:signal transduction histidine kinase
MQVRIRHQLAGRDRFVAAVAHDLRTPLSRLRLRSDNLADEGVRALFLPRHCRDGRHVDDHLGAFAWCVASAEPVAPLDIEALLQSLVDDAQDAGHAVGLVGSCAPLPAQAGDLRRWRADRHGAAAVWQPTTHGCGGRLSRHGR